MHTIITLLTFILLLVVAAFILLLPLAIIFNVRAGIAYREKLAGRIDKLRLGKMLSVLGIDIDTYVSGERGVDIHNHITRCEGCSNTGECDERMTLGDITAENIEFCDNEKSLQALTRQLK